MPFTAAHPAIVLPLNYLPKKYISLTALVIGSMAPDFEYFIRMRTSGELGHNVAGLFYFDLPLGLVLFAIFNYFVKNTLIDHLPVFLNKRFSAYKFTADNNVWYTKWLVVAACLLIGSASHLFWDSFTHQHRYFVKHIDILSRTFLIAGRLIPGFKILQHSSTLIGLLVIAYTIKKLPTGSITRFKNIAIFWVQVTAVAILVLTIRIIAAQITIQQYSKLIISGISSVLIGLLVVAIYNTLKGVNKSVIK